ncbi:TRAP-type C4-dicarboxylate transport system, small permease component [Hartmannibacter diazotrophicus]|uniref:TRAP transporter small permease protein n=1 Tax=Hartmannibacter diazotrophicus TaxID=1482074 RepID=A0A2C9DB11_9HYPH|nr:TRAP transporter small permease subunit [Hartmannibacter diazotrophicus]SON57446.1 TRAP-type C4-dicarboxylate transport system, small permease component [Hartmannibacter diazotrophicus]
MDLRKTIRTIELLCRLLTGLAFVVLGAAVLVQVVGRLLSASPVWTEELTRFALLYVAAFGAGLSYKSGDLVNVDLICESLPGRWPWRLRLFSATATAVLMAFLIMPAWKYTSIGAMQTSPALSWRMDFIHASVLVLLASLLLFSVLRVVAMIAGTSDGLPNAAVDDQP